VDAERLAALPLFSRLEPEHRARLAELAGEIEVPAGSAVVTEGDFGLALFVIEEGTAEVTRGGAPIASLGPGDVIGEIAVLSAGRRIASVVATTPLRLIALLNRDVWRLERDAPEIAESLRALVRERIEQTLAEAPAS
jgi:CRP-like cAMP-binding protein